LRRGRHLVDDRQHVTAMIVDRHESDALPTQVWSQEIEMDANWLLVGQAAKEIDESPKRVADLMYRGCFPPDLTYVASGRRFVHRSLLPVLKAELRSAATGEEQEAHLTRDPDDPTTT
jgi:hypothetical protein